MEADRSPRWSVGSPDGDRLDVFLLRRPPDDETGDSISALARIRASKFSGEVRLRTNAAELRAFREQVETLGREGKGAAELTTMFGHVRVRIETDGEGPIEASGYLKENPCFGNEFYFHVTYDRGLLGRTAEQIAEALGRMGFGDGPAREPAS
jgi:hypothetical protein